MSCRHLFEWHKKIKQGQEDDKDDEWPGCPTLNVHKFDNIVRKDC